MGLCNVYSWQLNKTVKLSDSYQVLLMLDKPQNMDCACMDPSGDPYVEMYECISVGLPTYKYKEEIYQYGNNAKKFLIPDYDAGLEDLTLEFNEHYVTREVNGKKVQYLAIDDLVRRCLAKLFDIKTFSYKLDDYIAEIKVRIFNNRFSEVVTEYIFNNLKLTNYEKYDLDYASSEIAKWKLSFSYQSYTVDTINLEPIKFKNLPEAQSLVPSDGLDIQYMTEAQYNAYVKNRDAELKQNQRGVSTLSDDLKSEENRLKALKSQKKKLPEIENEKKKLDEAKEKIERISKQLNEAKTKQYNAVSDIEQYKSIELEHSKKAEELRLKHTGKTGINWKASETADELVKADTAKKKKDAATESYAQSTGEIARLETELAAAKEEMNNAQKAYNKQRKKYGNAVTYNTQLNNDIKKSKAKIDELTTKYEAQEAAKRESAIGAEISKKSKSMQDSYSNGQAALDANTQATAQNNTERPADGLQNTTGGDAAADASRRAREAAAQKMAEAAKNDTAGASQVSTAAQAAEPSQPVETVQTARPEQSTRTFTTADIGQEKLKAVKESDEYLNRVRDISMTLYDPKRNNAQLAYEKAQQQAMEEYLTGKLKVS